MSLVALFLSILKQQSQKFKATQIGSSRVFRLEFLDQAALNKALNSGFVLDTNFFESLFTKEYPGAAKAYDTGPHHNTKDIPCNASPKCTNCEKDHVSYSLRYNMLKKVMSKVTK